MAREIVSIERRGPVALVRFDRGGSLNAFNEQQILELTEVAREFHDDLETQAVVLAGRMDAFSAGADLKERAPQDPAQNTDVAKRARFYRGGKLCQAWEDMPQITIAAMERMSVGAGCALALACDWRVLGKGAYLYVPEVKIGLNLQWGALPRLITLVGPAKAKRIVLMGEKMAAQAALDWGLVDEIADDGHTVDKALEMAEQVVQMPWATTRMVKEAVNATANALHRATSFADADQSQLTSGFTAAGDARREFSGRG